MSDSGNTSQDVAPDRILAFSDGVFAIAITLLVLNIHIPQPSELGEKHLLDVLREQWPSYLSFLLSFLIVGVVWGNHHTMFSYIKRSNHMLVVFNLLLLLNVALLPFAAGLLGTYIGRSEQQTTVLIYSGLLTVGGILYNLLWLYASRGNRLLDRTLPASVVRKLTIRYLFGPGLYGLAFLLSFLWQGWPGLILCGILAIVYLLPTVADRVEASSPRKDVTSLRQEQHAKDA